MATSFEVKKYCFEISFHEILKDPVAICFVAEQKSKMNGYIYLKGARSGSDGADPSILNLRMET